jgi:hypothetical protein
VKPAPAAGFAVFEHCPSFPEFPQLFRLFHYGIHYSFSAVKTNGTAMLGKEGKEELDCANNETSPKTQLFRTPTAP